MFFFKDFHGLGPLGRVALRGVIFVCVSLEMCVCMCHCIANHPLRWRPLVEERIPTRQYNSTFRERAELAVNSEKETKYL